MIEEALPARVAQMDRALDLKTRGRGFDSRTGQPNKYNCLADETLNRDLFMLPVTSTMMSKGQISSL